MVCTKTENDNNMTLRIIGDLRIPDVAELREDILPCLASHEHVSMDLRDVGEVDTAGLQLLLCVSRSTTSAGNRISIENIPQTVISTAAKLGMNPLELSESAPGGGQCPK